MKKLIQPLLLGLNLGVVSAAAAAEPPNIIVIYADDIGLGDLSIYGSEHIKTPALDRLANQGRRFNAAYATSSMCTPSRYSLLTGEYAFRQEGVRVLPGNAPLIIDPERPTIASVLRDHGYATGLVGKWHVGLGNPDEPLDWNGHIRPGPNELGFEYAFHMAATNDRVPTVYIENGHVVGLDPDDPISVSYEGPIGDDPTGISHPHLLRSQADLEHAGTIVDGTSRIGFMSGGHAARWVDEEMGDPFLNKAIDFIEENKDGPFFLYYAKHENHVPRIPHPRFLGSSSVGVRGDAVVQADWSVGRIMEVLREHDLHRNTLVIFTSDNGPILNDGYLDGAQEMNRKHNPAGPHRGGKYSVWEGGTRMPFIVSWPGTIQPGITEAIFSQVDLLASLAAIAGADVPLGAGTDGIDLSDLLLGHSDVGRDHVVQQGVRTQALRKGPWKYIPPGIVTTRGETGQFHQERIGEPGALFYLPEDPREKNNLAWRYPGKVREMRQILQRELDGRPGAVSGRHSGEINGNKGGE